MFVRGRQNLSLGQRKRINIARAVYNEAAVYIFDDPFSSLDDETAQKMFKNGF
jgi:ABC-type multidrug transport system fused ATPase/permease subunit